MSKSRTLKKLQGEKSTLKGSENEMRIARLIGEAKPSFSELLSISKLSRPILSKHLRNLMEVGFIFKDTVKPDETDNPKQIGKIVYKLVPSYIDEFTRHFVEMRMKIPNLGLDKEMERKLEEHYEAIAKIWSEYLKSLIPTKEYEKELERE